jgi:hypothetical protein
MRTAPVDASSVCNCPVNGQRASDWRNGKHPFLVMTPISLAKIDVEQFEAAARLLATGTNREVG